MAALKTWNTLAEANVKAFSGLVNASWKTWDTLTIPSGGDPYWASVVLQAGNESGADTGTTFVDQSAAARTLTTVGGAQWDTAQFPTGLSSSVLCDGTGDYITAASSSDFGYGTGDFTIEGFIYANSLAVANHIIIDQRNAVTSEVRPTIYVTTGGSIRFFVANADRITSAAGVIATGGWYHFAAAKASGTTKLFVAGTQVGSDYTDGNTYLDSGLTWGARVDGANAWNGWLASTRITKGVARYTSTFTPPTPPYPTS